jgi:serine/threonine-protein kinase
MPVRKPEPEPTDWRAIDATSNPHTDERDQAHTVPPPAEPPLPPADTPLQRALVLEPVPRLFDKYELLDQIAMSGMSVIFKARHTLLDQVVALKMIRSGVLASEDEVRRFLHEARALARLDHPHIIRIHEIDQFQGRYYLTMPLAAGGNVAQHLDHLVRHPREAVALVVKIAYAVHHAHQHGILHRDLKLTNVLVDETGEPLVSDFGLAKILDANVELTLPGQMLGTPAYMAPEQAAGQNNRVTARTDVWALGVLLFELLTGQRPFNGQGREDVLHQIQTGEPPGPRTLKPGLDRSLEAIVLKCLEKEPAHRYGSAKELADELRRWLHGEARSPRWYETARRAVRLHPRQCAAVVLLLAGLALAAIALLAGSRSEPPPVPPSDTIAEDPQALRDQLAAGRPLVLVGETGMPRWHQIRVGDANKVTVSAPEGQPLSVACWGSAAVVELLPDPPCTRYVLRALMRHHNAAVKTDSKGKVGLCLAHAERITEQGRDDYLCLLGFVDHSALARAHGKPPAPRQCLADLLLCRHSTRPGISFSDASFPEQPGKRFAPSEGRGWRPLEVRVTPTRIQGFWDGERIGEVDPRELGQLARERFRELPAGLNPAALLPGGFKSDPAAPAPVFRPLLGLYVFNGAAWVRDVVLEPLPDNP